MRPVDVTTEAFGDLTVTELHDLLRLRGDVFVVEQTCLYPDIDGRDTEPTTLHHWIERAGSIAAYARTLADPDGATRIGRVLTAIEFRGEGLGARLIGDIVDTTSGPLLLDAQTYLAAWYQAMDFEIVGSEFVEHGIAHVPMALGKRR